MPTVVQTGSRFLYEANTHDGNQRYHVSNAVSRHLHGSLIDRGANGGIFGNDARVFHTHQRVVNVTGIDNHELNSIKIIDASAMIITQIGPVIALMRQYTYHGLG